MFAKFTLNKFTIAPLLYVHRFLLWGWTRGLLLDLLPDSTVLLGGFYAHKLALCNQKFKRVLLSPIFRHSIKLILNATRRCHLNKYHLHTHKTGQSILWIGIKKILHMSAFRFQMANIYTIYLIWWVDCRIRYVIFQSGKKYLRYIQKLHTW